MPDDLIARARRVAEVGGVASSCVLLELADRVESLSDDNRRLRAAIKLVRDELNNEFHPHAPDLAGIVRDIDAVLAPAVAGGEGQADG